MSLYVTDTHALIYYASQNQRQLSVKAKQAFELAEFGQAMILIPAPALWEISILENLGQIKFVKPFADWMRDLLQKPCFDCVPLDAEIIAESRTYNFNKDIFDAAIVATAKLRDLPLITKDVAITESGLVEIYW